MSLVCMESSDGLLTCTKSGGHCQHGPKQSLFPHPCLSDLTASSLSGLQPRQPAGSSSNTPRPLPPLHPLWPSPQPRWSSLSSFKSSRKTTHPLRPWSPSWKVQHFLCPVMPLSRFPPFLCGPITELSGGRTERLDESISDSRYTNATLWGRRWRLIPSEFLVHRNVLSP